MAKRKVSAPIKVGDRFSRLEVVEPAPRRVTATGASYPMWRCRCDCGKTKDILAKNLTAGRTGSCGCYQLEASAERQRTHGQTGSPEYHSWCAMRDRCLNPNNHAYADYGGRGITVCERWLGPDGFANFLADMGRRPSGKHSLDRWPDNDAGYGPDNCRWATVKQQMNNRRPRRPNAADGSAQVEPAIKVDKPVGPVHPGARFERLTVRHELPRHASPGGGMRRRWLCECVCGKTKEVLDQNLRNGRVRSCGCLRQEASAQRLTTHGGSASPEWQAWKAMRQRCTDPEHPEWKDYGGRGVTVCERWLGPDGFANFIADMGKRPSPKHSLDRWPNNATGIYEPDNCRWATRRQQQDNRRNTIFVTLDGETVSLRVACDRTETDYNTAFARRAAGWPEDRWFDRSPRTKLL